MRSARRPKGCWFEAMAATQKTVRLFVKRVETGPAALGRLCAVTCPWFIRRANGLDLATREKRNGHYCLGPVMTIGHRILAVFLVFL
jgi:hypothetical protein